MKIAFFCNYLNHHQVLVADELYKQLGSEYVFVATLPRNEKELKGGADYSSRPYCLLAGESEEAKQLAFKYARESEVAIFGACSQEYAVERAKQKGCGLSFEVGERWLKHGLLSIGSPVFRKWLKNYFFNFRKKPFYKLCCSAFASKDDERLGCYKNRHFKWGYFTEVPETLPQPTANANAKVSIMWCARFIKLKHPELPIKMAASLKAKGYDFILDFYGSGPEEDNSKALAAQLNLEDNVKFHGAKPNNEILTSMQEHDVFLFTSNRYEGWGAVVNESMANGCAIISSDAVGSTAYLVKEGMTGYSFKDGNVNSLAEKVESLLHDPALLNNIKKNAYYQMQSLWSPRHAAESLLQLIKDLQKGKESSIKEGPCSKA